VIAILGVSASLAEEDRRAAHLIAELVGTPLVEVRTFEGDRPAYRRNGPDRCYFCKDELFGRISQEVTAGYRLDALAYGENADDATRPDRPGSRAAQEHAVLKPLADAGVSKAQVRRIAALYGLPCADKPAAPCLASRIPHFDPVQPQKLAQVERAETSLRRLGFRDVRVRHHGEIARVELAEADLELAMSAPLRYQVRSAVTDAGFRFVALDLAGIQSGAFTLPLVTS